MRFAKPSLEPSRAESRSSVGDFLHVNGELPYTGVVEGLEEFLDLSELQGSCMTLTLARRLSPVSAASKVTMR